MIWTLRHIGIHLWITSLCCIPLSFFIMPFITTMVPALPPFWVGGILFIIIIVTINSVLNLIAKKGIQSQIKEGQAWERSGILNKAEKNYLRALRIYDTFLLSPFSIKKTEKLLSNAIAKFKLNTSSDNENFNLGTAVYLKINPKDKEIAGLWLSRLRKANIVTTFEQDVLSNLAEQFCQDTHLSVLMIDIFLELERKDYIAKKLYQQILSEPTFSKVYSKKIEALIGKSEKTMQDEVSFVLPKLEYRKRVDFSKVLSRLFSFIQRLAKQILFYLERTVELIGSILSFTVLTINKSIIYFREHEKPRAYLKWIVLSAISAALLLFMINTMSHLLKSKAVEKEEEKIEINVPKPFTIQVAAYLKQKHADRYVTTLKKKGVDAVVKKVVGGGKTWYVIRVSEFPDKKTASEYGKKLKSQKIIDDFFVNNK